MPRKEAVTSFLSSGYGSPRRSPASALSVYALGSIGSLACILCAFSGASIASAGSFLSIWSVGSVLSINSMASILSINCKYGVLQICNNDAFALPPAAKGDFETFPSLQSPFVAIQNDKCLFGSCAEVDCTLANNVLTLDGTYSYTVGPEAHDLVQQSKFLARYDLYAPRSQLVKMQTGGGGYSTKTLTHKPNLQTVSLGSTDVALEDLMGTFEYTQLFNLYLAELAAGTTRGWCRGGESSGVSVLKNSKQRRLVAPDASISSDANRCNSMSAIKPDSVADCKPMQTCLKNKECREEWEKFSAASEWDYKCAYSKGEFMLLFMVPLGTLFVLAHVVAFNTRGRQ